MKLQLTKDKTIELKLPGGSGGGERDITGVELFSGDPRGCPAVRLERKKNAWQLVAAGFVPAPEGALPQSWEESAKHPEWSLPTAFQAPHAAFAVSSEAMFTRQSTKEALLSDIAAGGKRDETPAEATPGRKKLGLQRNAPEKKEEPDAAKPENVPMPEPGVPVSHRGTRFVVRPMADEQFFLETGLPEFQVLWLSRLLPEGRRPTVSSIQTHSAALLSAVLAQPEFVKGGSTALVAYVGRHAVHFGGYRKGGLVHFRRCPGTNGWEDVREGVKRALSLDDELVDSVLNDALIDPRPALDILLRPVLEQLEISRDYMMTKLNIAQPKILLLGLPAGARYWKELAQEALRQEIFTPGAFEGLVPPAKESALPPKCDDGLSQIFLGALGAARAALEVNA